MLLLLCQLRPLCLYYYYYFYFFLELPLFTYIPALMCVRVATCSPAGHADLRPDLPMERICLRSAHRNDSAG